jgi:hypothetical protein
MVDINEVEENTPVSGVGVTPASGVGFTPGVVSKEPDLELSNLSLSMGTPELEKTAKNLSSTFKDSESKNQTIYSEFFRPYSKLYTNEITPTVTTYDKTLKMLKPLVLHLAALLGLDTESTKKRLEWLKWSFEYWLSLEGGKVDLKDLGFGRNFRATIDADVYGFLCTKGKYKSDVTPSDEEIIKLLLDECSKRATRLIVKAPSNFTVLQGKFSWESKAEYDYVSKWTVMVYKLKTVLHEYPMLPFRDADISGLLFRALPQKLHAWILTKFVILPLDTQKSYMQDFAQMETWVVTIMERADKLGEETAGSTWLIPNVEFPLKAAFPHAELLFPQHETENKEKREQKPVVSKQEDKPVQKKVTKLQVDTKSDPPAKKRRVIEDTGKKDFAAAVCINCEMTGHTAKACTRPCKFCKCIAATHSAFFCSENPVRKNHASVRPAA